MNCPRCGTPNPNGMSFCSKCGTPLPTAPQQPYGQPQPQFQQPQPQYPQQSMMQPGAQYGQPPYQPIMRRPSSGIGFNAAAFKTRMNLLGLIGAIIFLLCIFMPVFEASFQKSQSSYTVVGAGSLSSLASSLKSMGAGNAADGLFKDSGKYIAMFVIDIVISVGAMVISAAGIDIGVMICGCCSFVIALLTLIFSTVDIGSFYKLFTDQGISGENLSKMGFYFGIGIAPILMMVSSIIIITGGIYGFLNKRKRR